MRELRRLGEGWEDGARVSLCHLETHGQGVAVVGALQIHNGADRATSECTGGQQDFRRDSEQLGVLGPFVRWTTPRPASSHRSAGVETDADGVPAGLEEADYFRG